MDDWAARRKAELEARALSKHKKQAEPFVKVPLWWIASAAKCARSPATLVMVELLRASWKAKSLTFLLPNGRLEKLGVSRDVKRRVLFDLEHGGLVRVERRSRRTPKVTLLLL